MKCGLQHHEVKTPLHHKQTLGQKSGFIYFINLSLIKQRSIHEVDSDRRHTKTHLFAELCTESSPF